MKDARIRSRRVEREAVRRFNVRCFCLTRQDLASHEMAERFLRHLKAITDACSEPGPYVYAVYENRIERLPLDP